MKKLLLCLLIGVSGGVGAADWILLKDDENGANYFDRESLRYDPSRKTVTVWEKWELNLTAEQKQKSEIRASKFLKRFDCENRTDTGLEIVAMGENDKVLKVFSGESTSNIIPDSLDELRFKAVCTNPPYITINRQVQSTSDVDLAALEQDRQEAERAFQRDLDTFFERPENQVFVVGSPAWNMLDFEVRKIQSSDLVDSLTGMELLELARSRVAKMIDLPPIDSTPKRTVPKPSNPAKTTKKRK